MKLFCKCHLIRHCLSPFKTLALVCCMVFLDAGYTCTSSVKAFKDTVLSPLNSSSKGGRGGGHSHNHDKLTEADVAQCIGTMIQTASGLPNEESPSSSSGEDLVFV